ncbi:MAG: carbohydrate ABC transporter permease [Spirochaetota bacterium]
MPLIARIGRKSIGPRVIITLMYIALFAGAVTMIYPFLLMISGSTKSAVDNRTVDIIPAYLVNDTALYQKYAEGLMNEMPNEMQNRYHTTVSSFERIMPPSSVNKALVKEYEEFLSKKDLPAYFYELGFIAAGTTRGVVPQKLREFKNEMMKRYNGSIDEYNKAMGLQYVSWNNLGVQPEIFNARFVRPKWTPAHKTYRDFAAKQPQEDRTYFSVEGFYKYTYLKNIYGADIKKFNTTHGTAYASFDEIRLDERLSGKRTAKEREDWENFVRKTLNILWISIDNSALPEYRAYLKAKYVTIAALNKNYETTYRSFADVKFSEDLYREMRWGGLRVVDLDSFLQGWRDPVKRAVHKAPLDSLSVTGIDFLFRRHLAEKHRTVSAMNSALGTSVSDFSQIVPPQKEYHYQNFLDNRTALKIEFSTRNYRRVIDEVVMQGRAVFNTVMFCLLSVLSALIVNPLAAYALSRYKVRSRYQILLVLMLTMAFPPMVTQIPRFLMIRDLQLLNTFWALILPGLASGYSIFLLKGFFDSLPKELYESAQIDGAVEWHLFLHITMALSKPILAVIALNAFVHAYSAFMYALLICQDPNMWTLMVWLYQLQRMSGPGVMYASLIIAALPTFLVFAFAQDVIMRGIVVPTEK